MEWFQLEPLFVLSLTQVLLLSVATVYLLRLEQKTKGSRLLAIALGLFCITWIQQLLHRSFYGALPFDLDAIDELTLPLILYTLLHFAYAFLSNPFERESKVVLSLTGTIVALNTLLQCYAIITFFETPQITALGIELCNLLLVLAALSVYVRKRALRVDGHNPTKTSPDEALQGKERSALTAFALLTAGMLFLSLRGIWVVSTLIWPGLGTTPFLLEFVTLPLFVLLMLGLVVVYVNHMPEPTTIQVKIIGLSLATLLTVLGLADPFLFSESKLQQEGSSLLPNRETLRFEPDKEGGYRVAHVPFQIDYDMGNSLGLTPESERRVSINFPFPYAGKQWTEMYVDSNGLISFGGPYLSRRFDDFYQDPLPKIAPFYRSLVPLQSQQSGVYLKNELHKTTVTWFRVWESLSGVGTNRNTVQLVLYDDGAIEFIYDRIEAPLDGSSDGLRGLRTGSGAIPVADVFWTNLPTETVTAASLPQRQSIRFTPDGRTHYGMAAVPYAFDSELGSDLQLADDTNARITFDFNFPFYEADWSDAYVSANGALAFGSAINPPDSVFFRPLLDFLNKQPKIAPFFVDLNPAQGGGVYHKRESDKSTVTWYEVPLLNTPFTSSVQMVLHRDGAIDFHYDRIGVALYSSDFWGVYPGDDRPRPQAAQILFDLDAEKVAGGIASIEDFGLLYRRFVHAKIAPLALITLLSVVFILGVFPLFFRASLVKPLGALLQGVRRVNEGHLDTPVPVRVNDEIGILAQNFNHMTASLKAAEAQLRTYAEGLENKVAERTADLEQALMHLTETQDQLIHAEKMASLGSLTAGIAHELKNPLNFINNFSELSVELVDELVEELRSQTDPTSTDSKSAIHSLLPDLKHNANKIREHGERADGIVKSMLEHSRGGTDQRRLVDINRLVEQNIELALRGMQVASPEFDVTVNTTLQKSIGAIELAPQEFGRVIINLLNNAFYAVHERSLTEPGKFEPTVAVTARRNDEQLEICISDNGAGIDPGIRKRIFEPFFTTKPTGTGTGLGLSLSHDIVTRGHGGTLTVESETGEGATFTILLPFKTSADA